MAATPGPAESGPAQWSQAGKLPLGDRPRIESQQFEDFLARLRQAWGLWTGREDQPSSSCLLRELVRLPTAVA